MATLTGKASVIHDCQMPPSLRPNFCRALEHHDYLSAPTTLPVVWRLPQARFLQQARRQSWQRLLQPALWSLISVLPNGQSHVFTDTARLWEPWPALGNEVCLWGNLMHPVVCGVGRRLIIADGHLMSAKLSPFSSQTNIKDFCCICSKVF